MLLGRQLPAFCATTLAAHFCGAATAAAFARGNLRLRMESEVKREARPNTQTTATPHCQHSTPSSLVGPARARECSVHQQHRHCHVSFNRTNGLDSPRRRTDTRTDTDTQTRTQFVETPTLSLATSCVRVSSGVATDRLTDRPTDRPTDGLRPREEAVRFRGSASCALMERLGRVAAAYCTTTRTRARFGVGWCGYQPRSQRVTGRQPMLSFYGIMLYLKTMRLPSQRLFPR